MKNLNNLTETELLGAVLEATMDGMIGASLKEIKVKDDKVEGELEINSRSTDRCKPILHLTREHLFLDLNFSYEKDMELLALKAQFNEYLAKSTKAVISESEHQSGFVLIYDIVSIKDGITYQMSCANPIFMYQEGNTLKMVFNLSKVAYRAYESDYSKIDEELDYERKVREEQEQKEYAKEMQINEISKADAI